VVATAPPVAQPAKKAPPQVLLPRLPEKEPKEPAWPTGLNYIDLSPSSFLELFRDKTYDQNKIILNIYKDEWMKVDGTISADPFFPNADRTISIFVSIETSAFGNVALSFDKNMMREVVILKKGTKIRAVGQLNVVLGDVILLEHSKIVSLKQ
jgi:hypothetical protein